MYLYLRPIGNTAYYSDWADYSLLNEETVPYAPPYGFEWVNGSPPEGAVLYHLQTLEEKLNTIYQALPVETRSEFLDVKAAIQLALQQGDIEVAQYRLAHTDVPAELETFKTQMLAVFNA